MDYTSTDEFLRAIARFTTIRPLWYLSSRLCAVWLGSEDNHFINHSGHCQHLSLTPPVCCVTLLWGVWLLVFHKTGLSAPAKRPCRQSLYSAAEGNILISRPDYTPSPSTVVMFALSIQTQSSTEKFALLRNLVVVWLSDLYRRQSRICYSGYKPERLQDTVR
jgi:hypothetical protein